MNALYGLISMTRTLYKGSLGATALWIILRSSHAIENPVKKAFLDKL